MRKPFLVYFFCRTSLNARRMFLSFSMCLHLMCQWNLRLGIRIETNNYNFGTEMEVNCNKKLRKTSCKLQISTTRFPW